MKPLPRYWTNATGDVHSPHGKEFSLTLYGWSSSSLAEAAEVARRRLEQAAAAVRAGRELQRGGYYPRTPLREEVLAEFPGQDGELAAAITRNRYGAEVLNTDAVLIADVDLPEPSRASRRQRAPRRPEGTGHQRGGFFARLFGRRSTDDLIATPGHPSAPTDSTPAPPAQEPDPAAAAALARIQDVATRNPQWGFRTYRTAAGLRVIVTGTDLLPGTPEAEHLLQALDSDPLYVTLCATHETYRARLTPKPWRVGHRALPVPYPYERFGHIVTPWLQKYATASEGYATCAFISSTGPQAPPAQRQIVDLHDDRSQAHRGLPLA
ncbi:hypothetical protein [Ruania halotolerans]|uniref:hypothetical protein n=1 Tax=Ruania halotolerans TaxID=2897773 RepID=UPI001E53FC5D|nr:hypothetical protein [Ruania halotolerans]UFU07393.1 hypothetical protein LQF10_04580 [Ruania halotolerans]